MNTYSFLYCLTHLVSISVKWKLEHVWMCLGTNICVIHYPNDILQLFQELNFHTLYFVSIHFSPCLTYSVIYFPITKRIFNSNHHFCGWLIYICQPILRLALLIFILLQILSFGFQQPATTTPYDAYWNQNLPWTLVKLLSQQTIPTNEAVVHKTYKNI